MVVAILTAGVPAAAREQQGAPGALQRCRDAVAAVAGREGSTEPAALACRRKLGVPPRPCWTLLQRALAETRAANVIARNRDAGDEPARHRGLALGLLREADHCVAEDRSGP